MIMPLCHNVRGYLEWKKLDVSEGKGQKGKRIQGDIR